jgi:hypothetical protein
VHLALLHRKIGSLATKETLRPRSSKSAAVTAWRRTRRLTKAVLRAKTLLPAIPPAIAPCFAAIGSCSAAVNRLDAAVSQRRTVLLNFQDLHAAAFASLVIHNFHSARPICGLVAKPFLMTSFRLLLMTERPAVAGHCLLLMKCHKRLVS